MAAPEFGSWYDTAFNTGTKLSKVDVIIGNGGKTYPLVLLNGLQVGQSVQVDTVVYPRFSGQVTVDTIGNTVTFVVTASSGQKIVVPGVTSLVLPVSDQNDSIGRVYSMPFYVGDNTTIGLFRYSAMPGNSGIILTPTNNISSGGAQTSWLKLAPALPDGTVGSYGSAGAALTTPAIDAQNFLASASSIGDGTITLTDATGFQAGDYMILDYGLGSQETFKVSTISGNALTVPATLGVSHLIGASVTAAIRKFFLQVTIPLNAAAGEPQNWYNITIDVNTRATGRP